MSDVSGKRRDHFACTTSLRRGRVALWLFATLTASAAHAYRPFDSTDADVAAPHELEAEVGISTARNESTRSSSIPTITLNFGAGHGRELSIDATLERDTEQGHERDSLSGAGVTLKQVLRPGSLQGGSGISLAGAASLLIPASRDDLGPGGSILFIASRAGRAGTIHLDLGLTYETTHDWTRTVGLIVEGRSRGKWRPVAEFIDEKTQRAEEERSLLAGAIFESTENFSVDVAVRKPLNDDRDALEWRAGFTWSTKYR